LRRIERPCNRGNKRSIGRAISSRLEIVGDLTGAGDRFRTDDLVLGKHALYQLSYTRSPKR
jgi:hypothetical protein